MTVPVTAERNDYTGDGSTAEYDYSYRITDEDHLLVTVADSDGNETTLTKTTDYTVDGVGIKTGGSITLVDDSQDWIDESSFLASGWALTVRHVVPLSQTTDIRNQGAYYPEIHEDAFDYLMWVCKQQQDELNRCVKAGETGGDIPTPSELTATLAAVEDAVDDAESYASAASASASAASASASSASASASAAQAAAASFPSKASQAQAEDGTNDETYTTPLKVAQAIAALGSQVNIKSGNFTRDLSTASGSQDVSGVGFTPKAVIIFAKKSGGSEIYSSQGFSDGSSDACMYYDTGDNPALSINACIRATDGTNAQVATLNAFSSDGFQLSWTKINSPTGTLTCAYLAIG